MIRFLNERRRAGRTRFLGGLFVAFFRGVIVVGLVIVGGTSGFGVFLVVELLFETRDFAEQRFLVGDQMLDQIKQIRDRLLGLRIQIPHLRQLGFDPLQKRSYISNAHAPRYATTRHQAC